MKMKTRLLIIFAVLGFTFLITSIPYGESMRMVWDLDQMIERSDVIVIGTVQSTWVDIRPFDEQKIVDTAKIRVDEWLKNEKNSNTIDIRYYGHWAQTIENLMGIHRMDLPTHQYETGQRVLVPLSHEDSTMVMGEGYYPFFEGKFVINDDVAISQSGEQMKLTELYDVIRNSVISEPEVIEEKFHGLTKSQIIDIQQAELGCKKIGNQTYCDISIQEKIDYYLQQNQGEKENEK